MSKRRHAKGRLPRRPLKRKLPPVSTGHSPILGSIPLSDSQLTDLYRNGKTTVTIDVEGGPSVTKVVKPSNVKNGKVYFYIRSNGQIALRNFASDQRRHARHRAPKGKPFAGD
jgi:hypothetical protein